MKLNIFDLMITNSTDWKWVLRECEELNDAGYDTLRKMLTYYSEIFKKNNDITVYKRNNYYSHIGYCKKK